jgi:protocatechuate 3,4-dioxygenase beta subunit
MRRKDFLKKASAVVIGPLSLLACSKETSAVDPVSNSSTPSTNGSSSGNCTVGDTETDGPYPLYNKRDSSITHLDIREGKTGLPLNIEITIKSAANNCAIVPNARVDIWHCDKDGYYSGYTNQGYLGNQNNTDKTFCRGIATADANGVAKFLSIYPGWYAGRVTHIHAQIYVGGTLKLTTQIAFPEDQNTAVYNTDLYKAHGQNPTKNTTDSIIKDSLDNELASVVANTSGGYDLKHVIVI